VRAPQVEIRTERLLLRPAREGDGEALHAILGDAAAMAYWSTPPHASRAETDAWLTAMLAIDPAEGEDFIVEYDRAVIGKAGLFRFPEIGFIFRADHWGRGFAAEALRPILDRAFRAHRLPAVIADVDPRNAASLKLLTRLGFGEVGRAERAMLVGDCWCDSVYLRLSREGWAAARSPAQ